jgi:hypothetical protein
MDIARRALQDKPDRDAVLLELVELLDAWSDFCMIACAAGHRRAELEMTRHAQQRQDVLVRGLLLGGAPAIEIGAGIDAFGLDPDRHYHAFRARLSVEADSAGIERHLQTLPTAGRRSGLASVIDGDLCGFVATLPMLPVPTAIGVSAAAPVQELASVFRLATRALDTAVALGYDRHRRLGHGRPECGGPG